MDYKLKPLGTGLMSAQVTLFLLRELKSGMFSKTRKLPSELELSEGLGVSRAVVRDALSDLEREGFIERVRGVGTVINRNIVDITNRLDIKLEYNEIIKNTGQTPSSDSIKVYTMNADNKLCEKLEVAQGSGVIVCEKRIMADNKPVIYCYDYISDLLFEGFDFSNLNWAQPIYDILEKHCGLTVITDTTKVRAVKANQFISAMLEVEEGFPLLFFDEIGYGKMHRPLLHSRQYFTDFFDFTMLRKKI